MNLWVTTTKTEVIMVTGEDWNKTKRIFEDFNKNANKLDKISHYPICRKDLPQESSFLILLDPLYYLKIIVTVLQEVEGGPLA